MSAHDLILASVVPARFDDEDESDPILLLMDHFAHLADSVAAEENNLDNDLQAERLYAESIDWLSMQVSRLEGLAASNHNTTIGDELSRETARLRRVVRMLEKAYRLDTGDDAAQACQAARHQQMADYTRITLKRMEGNHEVDTVA